MKNPIPLLLTVILFFFTFPCHGQMWEIPSVFSNPYGARSCGMGEVGTALADDGSVLFFNPAGLDVPNEKWTGGSGTFFYEPLVPEFHIKDYWHMAFSANYQDTSFYWGQPGIYMNFNRLGTVDLISIDDSGRVIQEKESNPYEGIWALGWGFNLQDVGINNHHFGLIVKYIRSALLPGVGGEGNGISNSFAVDFGYLWTIGQHFRMGITLMNMGPSIYYFDPDYHIPIPFTMNIALAYKNVIKIANLPAFTLSGELRLDKELIGLYHNGKPDPFWKAFFTEWNDEPLHVEFERMNKHLGAEITFRNGFSVRSGYLINTSYSFYEFHFGLGLCLFNHYSFDWGYIYAPDGFMKGFSKLFNPEYTGATGVRNGQWQFSITIDRIFNVKRYQ
jgi:hypothetical protein